jgi:serine/threonine protein phosphatase 1
VFCPASHDRSAGRERRIEELLEFKSRLREPRRLYVIGDIHGCADLLDRMIAGIARDLDARPMADCLTVTVGDYIDRGPDSRGVLDRLARNPFQTDFIALKGNHEALFATFLRDPSTADHWRRLGGLETLPSVAFLRGRCRPADARPGL